MGAKVTRGAGGISDPQDSSKKARVGNFADGANLGDGLVTHAIGWLTESVSGIRRLWRSDETGYARVTSDIDLIDVTLTPGTAGALSAADVAADTQEIPGAVRLNGGRAILQSVVLLDEADQGISLTLVFLSRDVSLGTEDAAVSITDANARHILGVVTISTYTDLINSRVATLTNGDAGMGLVLEAAPESRSLWVAAITNGTPTYTAECLRLRLGLIGA